MGNVFSPPTRDSRVVAVSDAQCSVSEQCQSVKEVKAHDGRYSSDERIAPQGDHVVHLLTALIHSKGPARPVK